MVFLPFYPKAVVFLPFYPKTVVSYQKQWFLPESGCFLYRNSGPGTGLRRQWNGYSQPGMSGGAEYTLTVVFDSHPWALISGFLAFLAGPYCTMLGHVGWMYRVRCGGGRGGTRGMGVPGVGRPVVGHRGTGPGTGPGTVPTVLLYWHCTPTVLLYWPLYPLYYCTGPCTHSTGTTSPVPTVLVPLAPYPPVPLYWSRYHPPHPFHWPARVSPPSWLPGQGLVPGGSRGLWIWCHRVCGFGPENKCGFIQK